MFREMRSALNIPKSVDILDHINSLSLDADTPNNTSPHSRAQDAIKDIERNAMANQQPQPGLNELFTYLDSRGLRLALCTRNFELPVTHLLNKFVSEEVRQRIWPIITRETKGVRPKPSAEGIWACVEAWQSSSSSGQPSQSSDGNGDGVEITPEVHDSQKLTEAEKMKMCEGIIMVGDSVDDIEAGARAGAATVLLVNDENKHLLDGSAWPKEVDVGVHRLDDLVSILEEGFYGR